jgi:hypothetical protein
VATLTPVPAGGAPARAAKPGVDVKSSLRKKELYIQKRAGSGGAADSVSAQAGVRADSAGGVPMTALPSAMVTAAVAPALRALAGKGAPPQVECFEQRQPPDSVKRIITLDARALADSLRLGTLTRRGDTLAAINGRLTAVRVQCPER